MKALRTAIAVVLCAATLGAAPPQTTLRGFTVTSSSRERQLESRFLDIPSSQGALDSATAIAAGPHYAGTAADHALALFMRDSMRADGIDAQIEEFRARVDTPRKLVLELASDGTSGKKRRKQRAWIGFNLSELPEPSDPATAARGIGLPFNAGSADGDIRAPLVFANRGLESDYALLANAHVDVRGAIVLVRYGAEFRGLLAERAQAHHAGGVLFYSDPSDDGSVRGPAYPNGPWRPSSAIQRGWVGPNVRIPTLPISADTAQALLASLHGEPGPANWGGALPGASYPLARGPGRVHLVVKLDRKITTLWNTIGRIPGVSADRSVLLGAHRDAWVYGVGDNGDGVSTMLEVARGLGYLAKSGWRPQRTILIAGWDGEEIGLVGSTVYVNRHRPELERGCIAYLNADENVTGPTFGAQAVAAIASQMVDATHDVLDPATASTSIYDRWLKQTPGRPAQVGIPDGGSDRESFLFGPGIPVADAGFEGPFGVYHSSYDTVRFATRVSDPGFALHRSVAQLYGVLALRLADADVVPYTFSGYLPLMRAGFATIAKRAQRDGLAVDLVSVPHALDRLAAAAARIDPLVAAARPGVSDRELRAVHGITALTYGKNGHESTMFPDIRAALNTHDPAQIDAAMARTATAIARVTEALTR